jgi:ribonuclease P protein component
LTVGFAMGLFPPSSLPSEPLQGLPRARRIRKRADFVRIQEGRGRVTTRHLLFLLAVGRDPHARLGVVASRKVGPAVTRNRAKRLVREVFRRSRAVFPAGFDVVVIVRPSPRWGPRRLPPPAPSVLGLAELAAEVAGAAPALARRARELGRGAER